MVGSFWLFKDKMVTALKLDPWEGFLDFNPSEVGHMLDDKDNDDNGND